MKACENCGKCCTGSPCGMAEKHGMTSTYGGRCPALHPIDCLKGTHEKTGFVIRLYPKGWGVYTGAVQHVSKRNVFAMLEWLHEQQAKPHKDLFNPKEVLYDQNRSHNAGL